VRTAIVPETAARIMGAFRSIYLQKGEIIMMNNRERLQRAMRLYVTRAKRRCESVDVNKLALSLSSRYPQSGVPIHVICEQIEAMLSNANGQPQDPLHSSPSNLQASRAGQLNWDDVPATSLAV